MDDDGPTRRESHAIPDNERFAAPQGAGFCLRTARLPGHIG